MFKSKPDLEWEIRTEGRPGEAWPPLPRDQVAGLQPHAHDGLRRATVLAFSVAVFLLAGIGVVRAHQEALKGLDALEQELQATVEVEEWTRQHAPEILVETAALDDLPLSSSWTGELEPDRESANNGNTRSSLEASIQDVRFSDGIAEVDLTLASSSPGASTWNAYRQTRFYRETRQGWVRTQPDAALWGKPQLLETEHIVWRYRKRDAVAVAAIADKMDALYERLQREYGENYALQPDKLVVNVRVEFEPIQLPLYRVRLRADAVSHKSPIQEVLLRPITAQSHSIDVPSPAIQAAPASYTDSEILAQNVAPALVEAAWDQESSQYGTAQSQPVLAGIWLWQLSDMGLGLSDRREADASSTNVEASEPPTSTESRLPYRYYELCAAHALRLIRSDAAGIPPRCGQGEIEAALKVALDRTLRLYRDASLDRPQDITPSGPSRRVIELGSPFMMFTVIDYAVTTYGRDRLELLVAALGDHDSWDTLVPQVYGVSVEEFERGWQRYIVDLAR